ncbi:putative Signal peptidase complex subunit 2 protein, partial [Trachipleistophora hominis]
VTHKMQIFYPSMDAIITRYNKAPIHCNIYSLVNLKVACNDLLIEYLTKEKGYRQKHTYTDMKIVVGLISVVCAALTCYMSMNYSFEDYRKALVVVLAVYFSFNFVLEISLRLFARNTVFEGYNKEGSIRIDGFNRAVDTDYKLIIYKNGKAIPGNFCKSVYELYDESGVLDHEAFLREVAQVFA